MARTQTNNNNSGNRSANATRLTSRSPNRTLDCGRNNNDSNRKPKILTAKELYVMYHGRTRSSSPSRSRQHQPRYSSPSRTRYRERSRSSSPTRSSHKHSRHQSPRQPNILTPHPSGYNYSAPKHLCYIDNDWLFHRDNAHNNTWITDNRYAG